MIWLCNSCNAVNAGHHQSTSSDPSPLARGTQKGCNGWVWLTDAQSSNTEVEDCRPKSYLHPTLFEGRDRPHKVLAIPPKITLATSNAQVAREAASLKCGTVLWSMILFDPFGISTLVKKQSSGGGWKGLKGTRKGLHVRKKQRNAAGFANAVANAENGMQTFRLASQWNLSEISVKLYSMLLLVAKPCKRPSSRHKYRLRHDYSLSSHLWRLWCQELNEPASPEVA